MSDLREYDYFGDKITPLDKLRMQSSLRVRRQMYDWFCDRVGGVTGKRFLDHGSTPDTEHIDSNCWIRWLLQDGATVYATSPEPIKHLEAVFPGAIVVSFPPRRESLPQLDFVLSSAVIEHVGSLNQQVQYVRDLLDLARGLFLTTPNRYHWLDFHTKLPLLHWLPRSQHRRLLSLLGLDFWAREANLRLLSQPDLARILWGAILEGETQYWVEWNRPRFLGAVSNLAVLARRTSP